MKGVESRRVESFRSRTKIYTGDSAIIDFVIELSCSSLLNILGFINVMDNWVLKHFCDLCEIYTYSNCLVISRFASIIKRSTMKLLNVTYTTHDTFVKKKNVCKCLNTFVIVRKSYVLLSRNEEHVQRLIRFAWILIFWRILFYLDVTKVYTFHDRHAQFASSRRDITHA